MNRFLFFFSIIILVVVASPQRLACQPGIMNLKARVYRLTCSKDNLVYEASGVMFSDNNFYFLITNKHFVQSKSEKFIDSLYLFLNSTLANGDVLSGPEKRKVKLNKDKRKFFLESKVCDVDLVLIQISKENSNFKGDDSLFSIRISSILEMSELRQLQNQNSIVTVVGYPGKKILLSQRTPEYTWGDTLKIEKERIMYNAPVKKGSSGSIVVMRSYGNYYFLGIHTGQYNNSGVGMAIPSFQISNCFESFLNEISEIK